MLSSVLSVITLYIDVRNIFWKNDVGRQRNCEAALPVASGVVS